MSMTVTRPYTRPRPEPEPEERFDITITFTDDDEPLTVTDVSESEVATVYRCIGDPEGFVRLQPRPGFHYMTASRRMKHITATRITESSN